MARMETEAGKIKAMDEDEDAAEDYAPPGYGTRTEGSRVERSSVTNGRRSLSRCSETSCFAW